MRKVNLTNSTFWYSLGTLFSRAISFILLPIYSNIISPKDFGIYALTISVYSILSVVYQGGIHNGLTKYFLQTTSLEARKRIFSTTFIFVFLFSFILSGVGTFASGKITLLIFNELQYSNLVVLAIWMCFIDNLGFIIIQILRVEEKVKNIVRITVLAGMANLVLNIGLLLYFDLGIKGIFFAQIISGFLTLLLLLPTLISKISFTFEKEIFKKMLQFSFPIFIGGIFSILLDVIDRFILDHYLGTTIVGIYNFGYKIAMIMNVFVIAFRSAWIPHAMKLYQNHHDAKIIFGQNFTKLVLSGTLLFLSVSIFIDNIFNIEIFNTHLLNEKYLVSISIIPYILIAYFFNAITSFYSLYPYITGKSYHFLISDTIALFLNIFFNYLFIPRYGMVGAAYATLIGYAFNGLYFFSISRKIRIDYNIKAISVIVCITVAAFGLSNYLNNLLFDLCSFLVVVYIAYKISGYRINIFKAHDIKQK